MGSFFKLCFQGLLYLILLPFLLILMVIVMVIGLIYVVIKTPIGLVSFFMGNNPFGDLKEDREIERILNGEDIKEVKASQVEVVTPIQTTENISNQQVTEIPAKTVESNENIHRPQLDLWEDKNE